jgi:polysaccharide deacetylase 2 family uncharacterized protein YibQ
MDLSKRIRSRISLRPAKSWRILWLLSLLPLTLHAGQLAIIIDDIGYNTATARDLIAMKGDFTLAVLPFTPFGQTLAEQAHEQGKEIILHAPMSNLRALPLEENFLHGEMSREDFLEALQKMIAQVPHIQGINNHMGSLLTSESQPMHWLMAELTKRKLYFVDSRTNAESVALQTAQLHQVPSVKRDVFLDNVRTPDAIKAQLRKAILLAKSRGSAVAIGHPYPETVAALAHINVLLEEHEVELVRVSKLLKTLGQTTHIPVKNYQQCPAPPLLLWRKIQHNSHPRLQPLSLEFVHPVMKAQGFHANSI